MPFVYGNCVQFQDLSRLIISTQLKCKYVKSNLKKNSAVLLIMLGGPCSYKTD